VPCALTVKLRGRTITPDRGRGPTISPGSRGPNQTTHHGPLQRLLGVGSAKEAGISILLHQGDEFLDGTDVWHRLVTVPFHVRTEPEHSPAP